MQPEKAIQVLDFALDLLRLASDFGGFFLSDLPRPDRLGFVRK
jgi:hypothetical protein